MREEGTLCSAINRPLRVTGVALILLGLILYAVGSEESNCKAGVYFVIFGALLHIAAASGPIIGQYIVERWRQRPLSDTSTSSTTAAHQLEETLVI